MASPQLIDDSDPVVQYQSGWTWEPNVQDEVDHTRHWLNIDGITASLGFSGTGIQVVGTLMPSDGAGQPKTTYTIDGLSVGSYTAPFTSTTQYNVTYFTKRDLSPGSHTIIITSDFGSDRATFYLDYFLIYSQPPTNSGPTTTTTTHTVPSSTTTTSPPHTNTQTSTSTSTSGSSPSLSRSESATSSSSDTTTTSSQSRTNSASSLTLLTESPTSSNAAASAGEGSATLSSSASTQTVTLLGSASDPTATNSSSGTAVVVGAVIGGISLLVLIAITFFCARRRRRLRSQEHADINSPLGRQMSQSTRNWTTLSSSPSHPSRPTSESRFSESAYSSAYHIPSNPLQNTSIPPMPTSSSGSASIGPSAVAGRRISSSAGDSKLSPSVYGATTIHSSSSAALISASDHHSDLGSTPTNEHPDGLIPPDTPQNFRSEIARAPWHAPPGARSRAQSLLSAFSAGGPRVVEREREPSAERYQDSGLRMYSETALPPPYTPE